MSSISNLLSDVPAILVIYFFTRRLLKVNLKNKDRAYQFILPFIALIYCIFIIIGINNIVNFILNLLSQLPGILSGFGQSTGLNSLFGALSNFFNNLLKILNSNLGFVVFANAIIFTIYIEFKRLCLLLCKKIKKIVEQEGKTYFYFIMSYFYKYDSRRNYWCLKDEMADTRFFFKTAYTVTMVLTILLMLITRNMVLDKVISSIYYPAFAIILIGEVYFYLDGLLIKEYDLLVSGEEGSSFKDGSYILMRNILRKIFNDKLVDEGSNINGLSRSIISNDDLIRKYENVDDQVVSSFAKYFRKKVDAGLVLDQNYFKSSLELLNGKSILFNNPFYYDLIPYIFYPMNRTLLKHKKVLVVIGRQGIDKDIEKWVFDGLQSINNIPYMWKIGTLEEKLFVGDVAILSRSNITNVDIIENNKEFLKNVDYMVILEPNKLITTAQLGLNMIVKKCREDKPNRDIVYCLCDRNCDGLVDSMSHILFTSLSEVSPTRQFEGTSSYMCWRTDDEYIHHRLLPNISRFLGTGTELSFVALKNQVSKTQWFGGETFPVSDMKWIAKQYYSELAEYANIPFNEEMLDERFVTSANFWSAPISKNSYITVEDEFNNLFEIIRNFETRSNSQGFINVVSSQYLLRDYMSKNSSIFIADPKAIPNIAADYAKTKRNFVLVTALFMSNGYVKEKELRHELSLFGISTNTIEETVKAFWKELVTCYTSAADINELKENENTDGTILDTIDEYDKDIIEIGKEFNYDSGLYENVLKIRNTTFINRYINDLKSAKYVAEDEYKDNYLGFELVSHISQKYLPGQYLTRCGKYYQMKSITSNNNIMLRRASDHIVNRYDYRQIREYTLLAETKHSQKLGDNVKVAQLEISKENADFNVKTLGYYELSKYDDMNTAEATIFDKNETLDRKYRNKSILKIVLPECDENVRYTITLLLNEIFRSLFEENQSYIVAVTHHNVETINNPLTYSLKTENTSENCIYILEDSQLDLGLLESVERNINRIFEILCDYLEWHFEELSEGENENE